MADAHRSFVVLPWYRREDWPELKERLADGNRLHATYDEWLQASEALVAEVLATGLVAVKVHINPDEFAVWCARRYLDMDAEARAAFTVDAIARGIR